MTMASLRSRGLREQSMVGAGHPERSIGWSESAGFLVSVITIRDESGHLWGVNAFKSNDIDQN